MLIRRIFDSWDASFEMLDVADAFHHTSGEVGEALKVLFPGLAVAYGDSAGYALPTDDTVRSCVMAGSSATNLLRDLRPFKRVGCWPLKEGQPLARRHRPYPAAHAAY